MAQYENQFQNYQLQSSQSIQQHKQSVQTLNEQLKREEKRREELESMNLSMKESLQDVLRRSASKEKNEIISDLHRSFRGLQESLEASTFAYSPSKSFRNSNNSSIGLGDSKQDGLRIKKMQDEIAELSRKLEDSERLRQDLRSKYISMGNKVDSILQVEQLETEKNFGFTEQISEMKQKLKQKKVESGVHKDMIAKLEEENKNLLNQQQLLLQKNRSVQMDLQGSIAKRSHEEQLIEMNNIHTQELRELKKKAEFEITSRAQASEEKISKLSESLETTRRVMKEQEDNYSLQIEKLHKEVSETSSKLRVEEQSRKTMSYQLETASRKAEHLGKEVEESHSKIVEFQKLVESLKDQLSEVQAEATQSRDSLERTNRDNVKMAESNNELKTKVRKLDLEYQETKLVAEYLTNLQKEDDRSKPSVFDRDAIMKEATESLKSLNAETFEHISRILQSVRLRRNNVSRIILAYHNSNHI